MRNNFTDYQKYIHLSRYARWIESEKRRETWEETVQRYIEFFYNKLELKNDLIFSELYNAIVNLEVMPSMRALMTSGKALERDSVAGFNCAFSIVDNQKIFDEIMYVLMCGTGVGFSVERQFIGSLPTIPEALHDTETTIHVRDSKIGWASAYRELLSLLYAGNIPKWNLSKLRPAGARLKTFGGRSSGPIPLDDLFLFTISQFKKAQGKRLTSLQCHDIICKIADIVVVGGVRRSALLSLSNLTDERMRTAKSGKWYEEEKQRALANNSVCYTEKPDLSIFLTEWKSLYDSKCGERGFFNREAAIRQVKRNGRRDPNFEFGTNPCAEILLRSKGLCNLSEVVVRPEDTFEILKRKVRLATILGTFQSTLTNFRYLSKEWKKNAEEERLLGVSLTGIMDHPILSGTVLPNDREADTFFGSFKAVWRSLPTVLQQLREVAIATNKEWAQILNIPVSAAITCVKPSGTVSQLVDSASGLHPRYSKSYIRTVRADNKDPLTQMMKDSGVPNEVSVTKPESETIFSFPIASPTNSVVRNDMSAIGQLEIWKIYQDHWCEHKPSMTIFYKQEEFLNVGAWVYENFDFISGISFMPHTDHIYQQPPYQEITEDQYTNMVSIMPTIDWSLLEKYETEDSTIITKELACTANNCELE